MKLNINDYKNILKFYNINSHNLTNKNIKKQAEHLLAVKLCRCIKHVKTFKNSKSKNEKRTISICYNSVIKKKNIKIFKFKCKKTVRLLPKKGTHKIFVEKLK